VVSTVPATPANLLPGDQISLLFDMPVKPGGGKVFLGSQPSFHVSTVSCADVADIPANLEFPSSLMATFRLPQIPAGKVYLHVPQGAVLSMDSETPSQEYRFPAVNYWIVPEGTCVPGVSL
jgi:hypothetical protein